MFKFNKALYVNRQTGQELCTNAITNGHHLDIHGMIGQGKTEFLKWIHDSQEPSNYLCSYVDLSANNIEIYSLIAEQLIDQIDKTIFPDDPFADFKENQSSQTPDEDELINTFNNGLQNILSSYKIVLCFDNTESTTTTWQQFEDEILEYHNEQNNLILITAGQKPIRLAPRLRQRASSIHLSYFTEDEIQEQIQRLSQINGFQLEDSIEI